MAVTEQIFQFKHFKLLNRLYCCYGNQLCQNGSQMAGH